MEKQDAKKRRFPPGCWGPLMMVVGAGGAFVSFWLGTITAAVRPHGLIETDGRGAVDSGIWGPVLAVSICLLGAGAMLMLVQALLWLVHKATSR